MPATPRVQKRDDRALAVVVQRRIRAAVVGDSLPVFPDGRRAALDHREPRRRGVATEQLVRDIEMTGVREHWEQVRRRQEPRAEVGVSGTNQLDETRRRSAPRSSSGTRSNASARTCAACVSGPAFRRRRRTRRATHASALAARASNRAASSPCPRRRPIRASNRALWCRKAVPTCPWSTAQKRSLLSHGSNHSPKWNPPSHRYSSCGAGSGRASARAG